MIDYEATSESAISIPGSGNITASLHITVNGAEVSGSQVSYDYIQIDQTTLQPRSLLASLNTGDVVVLQYTAFSGSLSLAPNNTRLLANDTNSVGTVKPSAVIRIVRIQ